MTGHCLILVSQYGLSFITHLGTLKYFAPLHIDRNELFNIHHYSYNDMNNKINDKEHIQSCVSFNYEEGSQQHHQHIHISGYYNLPQFIHELKNLKRILTNVRSFRRSASRE